MKKDKQGLGIKVFLGLLIILIILNMIIGYSRNKKRQENIYNVMGKEQSLIKYDSKAYFVFDEYVIDSLEDIDLKLLEGKLIRSEEKIFDSANAQVNTRIKEQNDFLNHRSKNKDFPDREEMIRLIYDNKLSKLDLSFADSINQSDNFAERKKDLIKSYLSNDAFIVDKTGFYLNKLDNYESLINASNIDSFISDPFIIDNVEEDKLQAGLKYVNNKEYYILLEVKNLDEYLNLGINNLSISLDNQTYYVGDYEYRKTKDKRFFMKLKMHEGIDAAVKHRISDISLNFQSINSLKIPKEAIYKVNGQTGVYTIDSGTIQFAPVKIIYELDDMYLVLNSLEDVLSESYLDLVRKNNDNLNNDITDKDYIFLHEIDEFSNILLDIGSYEVGDRY